MCFICDGGTEDELLLGLHLKIARRGFTLIGVDCDAPDASWTYTIGLAEHCGHPELVLRGRSPTDAAPVLVDLACQVLRGRTFRPGAIARADAANWRFRGVPHRELAHGLLAAWMNYYGALGSGPTLRALDVSSASTATAPSPTGS